MTTQRPSRDFKAAVPGSPLIAIVLGLAIGLVVAFAAAWAYAYVDLFFPIWTVFITLVFGAVLGYAPSLVMFGGGLRNRLIGFPLVALVVGFGYWLSWAVWIHAALNRSGDAPTVGSLMAHPSELYNWIRLVHEIGAWSFGGNPVHGGALTVIWIGEAILILGTALAAGWKTLADDLPG